MAHLFRRSVVAGLLIVAFVLQGTVGVLAGTTGTIQGTVVDASTGQPIPRAAVTAASPSQTATTTADATGHYTFLSLTPDTYTISVAAQGTYDVYSVSGVTVQADQTQTVTLQQPKKLQQIGSVTSRAASSLIKPGTTADIYSINATTQDKSSSLGGGTQLNSAWSALAGVPGVWVAPNANGYIGASNVVSIRGGDYDQIGYEFDGVPVNRSFDNYPSGTLSSLGQQELQVYTGANPANAEAQGLSGYINQVIRTGTAPAYTSLDLAVGAPAGYQRAAFETGGANSDRTFSYYLGLGRYNQNFRYFDQFNGASLQNTWGAPIIPCGLGPVYTPASAPSCFSPAGADYSNGGAAPAYVLAPPNSGAQINSNQTVRNAVVNLHFGIPTRSGSKDDVQVLWDNDNSINPINMSANDLGGYTFLNNNGYGQPTYIDGYNFNYPVGGALPTNYQQYAQQYAYPLSPSGRPLGIGGANCPNPGAPTSSCIDPSGVGRDEYVNNQGIFKVQYQKNFGTSAFLRVYGYTYYSDWLNNGPNSYYAAIGGGLIEPLSPDYELSSHTRGVSLQFSDQLNPQHLLTFQTNYTTANTTRDNNTQFQNGLYGPNSVNTRTVIGAVVNAGNPTAGVCFTSAGVAASCFGSATGGLNSGAQWATLAQAYNGTVKPLPASCPLAGSSTTACQYLVVGNGAYATYNQVKPQFFSASLSDNWKPTEKLTVNLGLRLDSYGFVRNDAQQSPARAFWYNAFNQDYCFTNGTYSIVKATAPGTCPAGSSLPNVVNSPASTTVYNVLQPRIAATYSLDPNTVFRISYGRYTEAPKSAFQQYDALQANTPVLLYNTYSFQKYGFTTPNHDVRPAVSNNFDFSYEHAFPGQWAVKVTPFVRKTQDQIQQFFLDLRTYFVSGLNVGRQTSQGVEFELDKGDFSRDGLAGKLAFTYTNSYINYGLLPNGTTAVTPINSAILNYNAYTSYCASNPTAANCVGGATQTGTPAAQCYASSGDGTPVAAVGGACPGGSIANPYWNLPAQALFNPNANNPTYDILPTAIAAGTNPYNIPYVGTLVLQYKHGPLAITPALQFNGGQPYGVPLINTGVGPDTCTGAVAGTTRYDVTTCGSAYGGGLVIPNPMTGTFDGFGSYREPNQLLLHTQISYEVNKRLTLVGTFANLINTCWGGSKVPWAVSGACGYAPNDINSGPIGNNYNPGWALQPIATNPYIPYFASIPFQAFFEARLKL